MYQTVVLINHQPNNKAKYKLIKARPVGRAVIQCDEDGVVEHFFLLFEGENGMYHIQEIVCFSNPFRVFFYSSTFESFEDAFLTLSAFNNTLKRSDFE